MGAGAEIPFVVTAVSSWRKAPGTGKDELVLEVAIKPSLPVTVGAPLPGLVSLRLDAATWKPSAPYFGPDVGRLGALKPGLIIKDSASNDWLPRQDMKGGDWCVTLDTNAEGALSADWSLRIVALISSVKGAPRGEVRVAVDGQSERAIAFEVAPKPASEPIVRLWSEPESTNSLARGTQVVLMWTVKGIDGRAMLHGPRLTPAGDTIYIDDGQSGSCRVRALAPADYTLTANVTRNGELREEKLNVSINIEASPAAVTLDVLPQIVFPGGPFVCRWYAYDITALRFTGHVPEDKNYKGSETSIEDAYVVKRLPIEKDTWTLSATYVSNNMPGTVEPRTVHAANASKLEDSAFLHLPQAFGEEAAVYGLAAGGFIVRDPTSTSISRRYWLATATKSGLELWVHDADHAVRVAATAQEEGWNNKWLAEALNGEFLGVGAAEDAEDPRVQRVVAIRRREDVEVVELDFPLTEQNEPRSVRRIEDERFGSGPVRVVPVGQRVFLLGRGAACSYERDTATGGLRTEPWLAMLAFPEWEVVAVRPQRSFNGDDETPAAGETPGRSDGYLFALEKSTGTLLRFDVQNGSIGEPRKASPGNKKAAPLDALQEAQWRANPERAPFPKDKLEDGRIVTGTTPQGARTYVNAITPNSSMTALDGALLVRSEVFDPEISGLQDRAYDPRLDVWVRCGHPFPKATTKTDNHFAATRGTLYCRVNDEVWYVSGPLPSYLGFTTSDLTPIPAEKLQRPMWLDSSLLVTNRTHCTFVFRGGNVPCGTDDEADIGQGFPTSSVLSVKAGEAAELRFKRLEELLTYLRWDLRHGEQDEEVVAWLDVELDAGGNVTKATAIDGETEKPLDVCKIEKNKLCVEAFASTVTIKNKTDYDLESQNGKGTIKGGDTAKIQVNFRTYKSLQWILQTPDKVTIDFNIDPQTGNVSPAPGKTSAGRTARLCDYDPSSKTVTIRPEMWTVNVRPADGLKLSPKDLSFAYTSSAPHMEPHAPASPELGVVEVPSLTGVASCVLDFRYHDQGTKSAAKLSFNVMEGEVGNLKWEGERAAWFKAEKKEGGRVIEVSVAPVTLELSIVNPGKVINLPTIEGAILNKNILPAGSNTWSVKIWPHPQLSQTQLTFKDWGSVPYSHDEFPFYGTTLRTIVSSVIGTEWLAYHTDDPNRGDPVHRVELERARNRRTVVTEVQVLQAAGEGDSKAQMPRDYFLIDQDLRSGLGGDYVYICYRENLKEEVERGKAPGPIVDIRVTRDGAPPGEGFERAKGSRNGPIVWVKRGTTADVLHGLNSIVVIKSDAQPFDKDSDGLTDRLYPETKSNRRIGYTRFWSAYCRQGFQPKARR